METAEPVGSTLLVGGRLPDGLDANGLRTIATDLRGRVADRAAVIVLFSVTDAGDGTTKVPFAVATTAAARDAGIKAGDLVRETAPLLGGRGGGKPDLAQGSGTDATGIETAIARVRELIAR